MRFDAMGATLPLINQCKSINVVVDAVVRHWVTLAVEEAEKRGERGK